MVKNIIFDFGGVIIHLNPEEAIRRFTELGIADARQQLDIFGQKGIFGQVETGELSAEEFCRKLALEAKEKGGKFAGEDNPAFSFEEAQWAWMGYVAAIPQENLEKLLELQKSYNLYLLSNLNPFLQQWAESSEFAPEGYPLTHYIPNPYYSFKLKAYKPSAVIFHRLFEQAGINPEESLFVDDSPRNIEGAKAVGMQGLLVAKNADWTTLINDYLK